MKEPNLNEISGEFFPRKNSAKSFLSNTTTNNIQAFLKEGNKSNIDEVTAINSEEKENVGENIFIPNLESNEDDAYMSKRSIYNLPTNSQNHDTNIKMFHAQKNEKLSSNTNFTEKSEKKINPIIFSSTKTKRNKKNVNDSEKINFKRKNNARKKIGRNFFNQFFLNLILKMITICDFKSYLEKFPKEFIFNAVKKENKDFINYSFEELIKNAESYKVKVETKKDAPSYLGIMKKINSDENKVRMKEKGYDKYLKMNFKELFEEYLNSKEHKDKIEKLKSKKGESEKFKYLSNMFIQGYYN